MYGSSCNNDFFPLLICCFSLKNILPQQMDLFVINHRHTHRFPAHAILQVLRCFHSSGLCYMLFYFAKSGQGVGKMQLDQRSSHWTACIPHDFLNEKKNGCKLTLRSRKVLAGLRGQITGNRNNSTDPRSVLPGVLSPRSNVNGLYLGTL